MGLVPAADFPGAAGYLNTASIGLPSAPAVAAMRAELEDTTLVAVSAVQSADGRVPTWRRSSAPPRLTTR
jgi:hypothetical protein